MADRVTDQLAQRELLGAIATIARAAGCHVINLHQNITNPRNQSDPDLLCLLPDRPDTYVKCLLKPNLSAPQDRIRRLIESGGNAYQVWTPDDLGAAVKWFQ